MVLRLLVANSSLPFAHILAQKTDPRPQHLFYPPTSPPSPASPILFSSFRMPILLRTWVLTPYSFLSFLLKCNTMWCDAVSEYLRTLKKLQSTTTNLSLQEARTLEQRLRIIIEQKVSAPLLLPPLMSSMSRSAYSPMCDCDCVCACFWLTAEMQFQWNHQLCTPHTASYLESSFLLLIDSSLLSCVI